MSIDITAVIPVREGSRRLRNKNLAPFSGQPLLVHKIRQLRRAPSVARIVVSSDSERMLELAVREGVDTHRRSPEYADDVVGRSMGETIAYIADSVPGEVVMWAQCTSPLVDEHIYERAITEYQRATDDGYDSLLTVTRIHEYLWGEDAPVNFTPGRGHVPSQQLPELYRATFGVLLAPRMSMVQWGYYHGPNPYRMVLSKRESADIDDELDLLCARAWVDAIPELSAVNPFDESTETGVSPNA